MNHNVLVSRLSVAVLVGALAATALAACHRQAEGKTENQAVTRQLNAAESAGTILFAGSMVPGGPHDIYKKDLHTGQVTNLTNTPRADELNPQVSPDGKQAVYDGNASGNYQIYRVDLGSGNIVRLTNHDTEDFDPTYKPNGDILYKSDNDIWEMTGDGQNQRNLTPNTADTEEWKPTAIGNDMVMFTRRHADDGTMTRQQLANTDELMLLNTRISGIGPQRISNNGWPDWYSEADPHNPAKVAFTSKATPDGPDVIYKMDLMQSDPYAHRTQLTDPNKLPGDSSDCSWADDTLLLVNNGSGRHEALARTPNGTYYKIADDMGGDVLSPVAVGPITIG